MNFELGQAHINHGDGRMLRPHINKYLGVQHAIEGGEMASSKVPRGGLHGRIPQLNKVWLTMDAILKATCLNELVVV